MNQRYQKIPPCKPVIGFSNERFCSKSHERRKSLNYEFSLIALIFVVQLNFISSCSASKAHITTAETHSGISKIMLVEDENEDKEMSNHKPVSNLQTIDVKDGVMYFSDGTEVALFGTNYYPMSWWQYVNMKSAGADFCEAIRQDVQDMKALGIQIIRVHFFESEACDAEGNLIITEHLDIFDILVDELNKHGIYLYITALTWWDTPNATPDAFSRQVSKISFK